MEPSRARALDHLVQLFLLARSNELGQNFADTALHLFRSDQFVFIFESNCDGSPRGGLWQKAADCPTCADHNSRQLRRIIRNAGTLLTDDGSVFVATALRLY
jgi:hypothetical protein